MDSSPEDPKMTLRMLTLELKTFHSFGGITFEHRRQPLSRWFVTFLVVSFVDVLTETIFDFVVEYDEQLLFAVGNICAYFFGAGYRYIMLIFFYKAISLFSLIVHVTSNFDWIELVDNRLRTLEDRVIVTRREMGTAITRTKRVNLWAIYLWAIVGFLAVVIQTFWIHYGRLPWYLVLPTFVTMEYTIIFNTYLQLCLMGQYYLILSYCLSLVRKANGNLMVAISGNDHNENHIEQALSDFEVVASCVRQVWQYASKIYLLYLVATSCMIPFYIFNTVFSNIPIFIKPLFLGPALSFVSMVGFLSYFPGRIDMQLAPTADRLYRSVIFGKNARCSSNLRYKYLKYQMHALNGLGLTIAGYRINLSTCITLATVYVTIFSLLINSSSSIGRIEFEQ